MARKKVIVKHLAAIQNFGSMDVLCSDKTGTLTRGEMALDRSHRSAGAESAPRRRAGLSEQRPRDRHPEPAGRGHPAASGAAGLRLSGSSCDEMPFDFERRRLSVVVEGPRGPPADQQRRTGKHAARLLRRWR